eukprot:12059170-Heterocapsa_arctica.AAC.1
MPALTWDPPNTVRSAPHHSTLFPRETLVQERPGPRACHQSNSIANLRVLILFVPLAAMSGSST